MPYGRQLHPKMGDGEDSGGNNDLKRRAVQVAALLPDDLDDALRVLALAQRIVVEFLTSPD